jgi:hypothetical protein
MARGNRRSGIEVERIVSDFEHSALSRRAYCERHAIVGQTLDWYTRRVRASRVSVQLVPVRLENRWTPVVPASAVGRVSLFVPGNGRRIESDRSFDDNQLTRLIRIAGVA